MLEEPVIDELSFSMLCAVLERHTGLRYTAEKRFLVTTRLASRLRTRGVSVAQYLQLLDDENEEDETMLFVDALTTHETFFFREPAHYQFIDQLFATQTVRPAAFHCWSAASSSGEEAYSLAMQLAARLPLGSFSIEATDVSSAMVDQGARGLYPMTRAQHIPEAMLKRWCRRGKGQWEGSFLIERSLRQHVDFDVANLCQPQPTRGPFDLVMLRNVLIYFGPRERELIVRNVVERIKPGGWLLVGHSESVTGLLPSLKAVRPSIYRVEKP